MKRTAALHNLGCRVNEWETEAMSRALKEAGYEIVSFEDRADVYIVNTCTVTSIADRKSRQMLHRAKEKNPDAVVVAVGCYVQDMPEKLRADASVDLLVGNDGKGRIAEFLDNYFREHDTISPMTDKPAAQIPEETTGTKVQGGQLSDGAQADDEVTDIAAVHAFEEMNNTGAADRARAFLKIQDGCNQFCSYCRIPYVRGRVRSRQAEEITREAERCAAAGYHEIVLTGIHISSYGLDFDDPLRNRQTPFASEAVTNERLLDVIRRLADIPGIDRIRLGSIEPGILTEKFVREIAGIPEICPEFHISMQSGCDTVLARMRRKYRTADFAEKCARLRAYFSSPAITTDIIVGFPGETDEEDAASYAFTKKIGFARTHIFRYSRRPGTAADRMPHQVPEQIKKERSERFLALDRQRRAEYAARFTGRKVEILFEEKKKKDGRTRFAGHSREYLEAFCSVQVPVGIPVSCRVLSAEADGTLTVAPEKALYEYHKPV